MSSSDELLKQTIQRAKQVQALQESAYEIFLKQISEQIHYLQQFGITSVRISVPNFVNRIPIHKQKATEKIIQKLQRIGFIVSDIHDCTFIVSWNFL